MSNAHVKLDYANLEVNSRYFRARPLCIISKKIIIDGKIFLLLQDLPNHPHMMYVFGQNPNIYWLNGRCSQVTAPSKKGSSNKSSYDKLKAKRAWDVALAPLKSLPMQAFMLYMSGGGVQIFSIGIVFVLLLSPFRNLAGINEGITSHTCRPCWNAYISFKHSLSTHRRAVILNH